MLRRRKGEEADIITSVPANQIFRSARKNCALSAASGGNTRFRAGLILESALRMHGIEKRIVYILRSKVDPSRHYVGITNDVAARLEWHNHGPSGHTVSHRPWSLVVSIEFRSEREAVRFEKNLKSGSGRAFTERHFADRDDGTATERDRKDP